MTTGLGTDFAWVDGDVTDDLEVEDDGAEVYSAALIRRLSTSRLWYAPTYGLDVRGYLLDIATDAQIAIEVQQQVDADERTARSTVEVVRVGSQIDVAIAAWDQRGRVHRLTLGVDALTGALVVGQG